MEEFHSVFHPQVTKRFALVHLPHSLRAALFLVLAVQSEFHLRATYFYQPL